MELWTEYEGRTIDGTYPLTKLLQPEGRSAFFATSNGTGEQTVIRLIESHFDDEEIIARWRGIRALDHPNLVRLKKFGHVVVDETSLVYAVIEPVDANLAEILSQRALTLDETKQLAASMVSALDALHTNGFVHEHVATHTVLAVGETIKLRSDCIREAPEGEDGQILKQRDVHDLSLVLLEALTQKKAFDEVQYALPRPFDEIVRRGASGEWGLADIGLALADTGHTPVTQRESLTTASPEPYSEPALSAVAEKRVIEMPVRAQQIRTPMVEQSALARFGAGAWIAIGVVLVAVLWVVWHFAHSRASQDTTAVRQDAVVAAPVATDSGSANAATAAAATPTVTAPTAANNVVSGGREQWRVVAFTYNREGQAQQKAHAVGKRHPGLRPEVFSPNGRAPYLVTVGGQMSREDAFALAKRARREGVARDVYAQNYAAR